MNSDSEHYSDDEGSYLYENDSVMETPPLSFIPPLPTTKQTYDCSECDGIFSTHDNLLKHIDLVHKKRPIVKKGKFSCKQCTKQFIHQYHLYEHSKRAHNVDLVKERKEEQTASNVVPFNYIRDVNNIKYVCPRCKVPFQTQKYRDLHYKRHFKSKKFYCSVCSKSFTKKKCKNLHEKTCSSQYNDNNQNLQFGGGNREEEEELEHFLPDGEFINYQSVLDGVVRTERILFSSDQRNLMHRLSEAFNKVADRLEIEKETIPQLKVYISLSLNFFKAALPSIITDPPPVFNTDPVRFLTSSDTKNIVNHFKENIQQQIDNYESNGSGWVLHSLVTMDLHLCSCGAF